MSSNGAALRSRAARAWARAAVLLVLLAACTSGEPTSTTEGPTTLAPVTTTTVVNERPIADTSLSCAEARRQDDPMVVLQAFRAARLRGTGAEGCITKEASTAYCDVRTCDDVAWRSDPGPICLYACPDAGVVAISWYSRESEPPHYKLRVEMSPGNGARRGGATEGVLIGRGVAADGGAEGLVVVEATTSS